MQILGPKLEGCDEPYSPRCRLVIGSLEILMLLVGGSGQVVPGTRYRLRLVPLSDASLRVGGAASSRELGLLLGRNPSTAARRGVVR